MTAEVTFAKSFLTALESKPIKLQSDYAADPKTLELNGPYTLPRMPRPMTRPSKPSAPGSAPAVTVVLKSLRNPPLDLSLPAQSLTTSILDLKKRVAEVVGAGGTDKIRVLYNKKPCADSKSVGDVVGEGGAGKAEFSVMVMGGVGEPGNGKGMGEADEVKDVKGEDAPVAQGKSGRDVMLTQAFWTDLEGFLEQRVRDRDVAGRAAGLFQQVWKEKEGSHEG